MAEVEPESSQAKSAEAEEEPALARKRRIKRRAAKQRDDDDDEDDSHHEASSRAKRRRSRSRQDDGEDEESGDGCESSSAASSSSSGERQKPSLRGIKKQARYEPGVPMTKEELTAWRKEARRVRNRESAAASRKKTRERITLLESELQTMSAKYTTALKRIVELERESMSAKRWSSLSSLLYTPDNLRQDLMNCRREAGVAPDDDDGVWTVSPSASPVQTPTAHPHTAPSPRGSLALGVSDDIFHRRTHHRQHPQDFDLVVPSEDQFHDDSKDHRHQLDYKISRPTAEKIRGADDLSSSDSALDGFLSFPWECRLDEGDEHLFLAATDEVAASSSSEYASSMDGGGDDDLRAAGGETSAPPNCQGDEAVGFDGNGVLEAASGGGEDLELGEFLRDALSEADAGMPANLTPPLVHLLS